MKKILALAAFAYSTFALSATQVPVQLLNPTGSTAGQTIVSTGSATAPGWATVPLSGLSSVAANTVLANATASSAAPSAFSMPSCSSTGNALNWTTNTGFTCQTGLAPLASPTFTGTTTVANITATGTITGFSGRLLGVQSFTSGGTYTPTSGTGRVIIECVGGGGGGGGTAATSTGQSAIGQAGSSGSYARVYWTSPSSQTVTIGAAGTAASGSAGGNGGTTSLGSIVSCPGGIGGSLGAATSNVSAFTTGAAAQASSPTVSGATTLITSRGNQGTYSIVLNSNFSLNGQGGISPLSAGGGQVTGGTGAGGASGAAGASSAATAGTAGAAGQIIIYEYQ